MYKSGFPKCGDKIFFNHAQLILFFWRNDKINKNHEEIKIKFINNLHQ